MAKYVKPHEINVGDLIYLAHSSSTPSKVVEIGEPTHALAGQHGALALTVETYSLYRGVWLAPRRISVWPHRSYRIETSPEIWLCTARSCRCCTKPRPAYRVSELVSAGVLKEHGIWGSKAYIHFEADRSQRGAVVIDALGDRDSAVELSICVDCLFVLANGAESEDQEKAAERMTEKWGDVNITLGMLTGDDGCGHDHEATSEDHSEGCEQLGFSWRSCGGCGSSLGGDRFAATAWVERD